MTPRCSHSASVFAWVLVGVTTCANNVAVYANAYDFRCTKSWSGPDPHNDPLQCIYAWPQENLSMLTPPLLPFALCVLLTLFFPVVFCCRCMGACGSNMPRPGADCCCEGEEWDELEEFERLLTYPESHVTHIKTVIVIVALSCGACVAVMSFGVSFVSQGASLLLESSRRDVLDWASDMIKTISSQATKRDGTFIEPITNETFTPFYNLYDWGSGLHADLTSTYDTYITTLRNVMIVVSCLPAAAMVVVFVLGFFSVRKFFPRCLQVVYFVLGVLFGSAASLLVSAGIVALCGCGEITLQKWKAPGVFQWYLVPQCELESVFSNATSMLREMEFGNSLRACRDIMSICDSHSEYDNSSKKIFVCPQTESTLHHFCGNYYDMRDVLLNMPFKNGTKGSVCPSCETFADCSTKCTDQQLRNATLSAMALMEFAGNATHLINRYLPDLTCDALMTRFTLPFADCDQFSVGLLLVGGGATYATLVFVWGIILLCIGQKLFFDRKTVETQRREAYAAAIERASVLGDDRAATELVRMMSGTKLYGDDLSRGMPSSRYLQGFTQNESPSRNHSPRNEPKSSAGVRDGGGSNGDNLHRSASFSHGGLSNTRRSEEANRELYSNGLHALSHHDYSSDEVDDRSDDGFGGLLINSSFNNSSFVTPAVRAEMSKVVHRGFEVDDVCIEDFDA